MNKKEEASYATRKKLLEVARHYFSTIGYEKTSLEKLVDEVGMTRGALYHHYKNKKHLFEDLLIQIQEEVGQEVEKSALQSDDPWEQLVLGSLGFLHAATKKNTGQILLIDGPSVLGWIRWQELDQVNSQSHLKEQIVTLKENGQILPLSTETITHLISGGLNELALYLTQQTVTENIEDVIRAFLKGFRQDA